MKVFGDSGLFSSAGNCTVPYQTNKRLSNYPGNRKYEIEDDSSFRYALAFLQCALDSQLALRPSTSLIKYRVNMLAGKTALEKMECLQSHSRPDLEMSLFHKRMCRRVR